MPLALPLAAEGHPRVNPAVQARFVVAPDTGALSWTLPVGVVPGAIEIPVVLRYQASPGRSLAPGPTVLGPQASMIVDPGIRASLHFGFGMATGPGQCPGLQVLEDGTSLGPGDWSGWVQNGRLPGAFGMRAPLEGYAADRTRTYGRFTSTVAGIGKWAAKATALSRSTEFQVLMDRNLARIYTYQEALKACVPVLWVDRFGNWVAFQWWSTGAPGAGTLMLQATNAEGKGVQVAWGPSDAADGAVDLLRADFIGIPFPSLLVRGHPGQAVHPPSGASLATGFPAGRPTEILMGSPGSLPLPAFVPSLPKAQAAPPTPGRAWVFRYSDPGASELCAVLDPWGVTTHFAFETLPFPDGSVLRGVNLMRRVDGATRVVHESTWSRKAGPGDRDCWTVEKREGYSDGSPTEAILETFLFQGNSTEPGRGFLKSLQIRGESGNAETTTYEPGVGDGPLWTGRIHMEATGRPDVEILRVAGPKDGGIEEVMKVAGATVQTRAFVFHAPMLDLGPGLLVSVTRLRTGLPGIQEVRAYSDQEQLTRHTVRAGGKERGYSYVYDASGSLKNCSVVASWAPASGPTWTYEPGALGPTRQTTTGSGLDQPLVEAWDYGDTGQVAHYTDSRGRKVACAYDLWGRPLTRHVAGSPALAFHYPDERTREWRQGSQSGAERFDGFGRLQTRLRADGVTESYRTDTLGRLVSIHESNGKHTRIVRHVLYDALGRVVSDRAIQGPERTYRYRADGIHQIVTMAREGASPVVETLNPWGRMVCRSDSSGITETTYGEWGQATRIVRRDPDGRTQTRSFSFDGLGHLTHREEPETGRTTFEDFTPLGQPTRVMDANHRTTLRTFDAAGRLRRLSGPGLSLFMEYRGPFLAGKHSSDGISQTFSYDGPGGRLDSEALTIHGVKRTVLYGYDGSGSLSKIAYPSGGTVTYLRDDSRRIMQVARDGKPLASVDYDAWGNRTRLLFASGARSDWTWDEDGRHLRSWTLTHADGTEARNYRYDAFGHLVVAGEWTLQHDPGGRLFRASAFDLSTAHGYDAFGNAITHAGLGSIPKDFIAFSLGPLEDNRMPGIQPNGGLTGWVVGPNGEATTLGTEVSGKRFLALNWDDLGRLASVHDSASGAVQHYGFAPSGLRVTLDDTGDASLNRQFLYSDGGLLLGEYLGNGAWNRDVVYLGAQAIAEVGKAGIQELHSDHLDTPRVITSGSSGTVVGRQAFGAYGETLALHTSGYHPLTGYTGHLQADATGLVYMRGRFYCPAWQRFVNSDQGLDIASPNQFAYAAGSPFQRTDPSGFMFKPKPQGVPMRDGMIDGGEATVVVEDTMPDSIPFVRVPEPPRIVEPPIPKLPVPAFPGPPPIVHPDPGSRPFWGGPPTPLPRIEFPPEPKADPIDPQRFNSSTAVANPATPGGWLASAVASGDYRAAMELAKAQLIKEKIGGAGAYWVNRKIAGNVPKNGPVSHTFTFTTNPDGTLLHTYSWGNQGIIGSWVQDAEADKLAANQALKDLQFLNFIGGADYIDDVDRAYRAHAGISSETHMNFGVIVNCKSATDSLVNMAIRIHNSTRR